MTRVRLDNRREHEVVEIEHSGFRFIAGGGRYPSGRLSELFIDSPKRDSLLAVVLQDSAILVSILLPYGASAHEIRRSLSPTGPVGAILDKIEEARS
jgi:hypothetical protein